MRAQRGLLDAELDVLDARGDLIHHLLLDSIVGRSLGHGGELWFFLVAVGLLLCFATGRLGGGCSSSWRRESRLKAQHVCLQGEPTIILQSQKSNSAVGHISAAYLQ